MEYGTGAIIGTLPTRGQRVCRGAGSCGNDETSNGRSAAVDSGVTAEQTYFRRGLGLKKQIEPVLAAEYHSALVEDIRARGFTAQYGDITLQLAQDFGFCYGVDRAVDYAYQTTYKFPDRRIFLVGEIIHNPHVNTRLREAGVTFLYPDAATGEFDFSGQMDGTIRKAASRLVRVIDRAVHAVAEAELTREMNGQPA